MRQVENKKQENIAEGLLELRQPLSFLPSSLPRFLAGIVVAWWVPDCPYRLSQAESVQLLHSRVGDVAPLAPDTSQHQSLSQLN